MDLRHRDYDDEAEYIPHPPQGVGFVKADAFNYASRRLSQVTKERDGAYSLLRHLSSYIVQHKDTCRMIGDEWHKAQYEQALASVHTKGPAWEDLSVEQKARVRAANLEFKRDMDELAEAIRANRSVTEAASNILKRST